MNFFRRLGNFQDFERRLQVLEDLIYPDEALQRNEFGRDLGPAQKPRWNLGPSGPGSDTEPFHRPSNETVLHNRASSDRSRPQGPTFNRTNLVLTRNSQVSDEDLQPQDNVAVSPFPRNGNDGYAENELPTSRIGSRSPPILRASPRLANRSFLSPSSASVGYGSRGVLGEIHEMDTGGVYMMPDDSVSHSGSSIGWRGRQ